MFRLLSVITTIGIFLLSFTAQAGVLVPSDKNFVCSANIGKVGGASIGFTTIIINAKLVTAPKPYWKIESFSSQSVGGGLTTYSRSVRASDTDPIADINLVKGSFFQMARQQRVGKPAVYEDLSLTPMAAGSAYPWLLQWNTAAGNSFSIACNLH